MEWYFGNEVDDLVVPKGYEQAQMISSSPENWLQWGMTGFGNSYPKKNMTHEELTFKNSSMGQELYNNGGSLLWNDEADFQQFAGEETRINNMDDDNDDDIFFSSLLEGDATKADTFEGEMVNSQNIGRDGQSIGSSKYFKTHAFSPSKHTSNNENLMEESVLNDLERVTAQFTDKTRICFRDAFYRLAESSKQSLNSSIMTSNDNTLRAGEAEHPESKTNVIDRAVVSLVFHKYDFDDTCSQHQTGYNDDADFCDLEI